MNKNILNELNTTAFGVCFWSWPFCMGPGAKAHRHGLSDDSVVSPLRALLHSTLGDGINFGQIA